MTTHSGSCSCGDVKAEVEKRLCGPASAQHGLSRTAGERVQNPKVRQALGFRSVIFDGSPGRLGIKDYTAP